MLSGKCEILKIYQMFQSYVLATAVSALGNGELISGLTVFRMYSLKDTFRNWNLLYPG